MHAVWVGAQGQEKTQPVGGQSSPFTLRVTILCNAGRIIYFMSDTPRCFSKLSSTGQRFDDSAAHLSTGFKHGD